MASGIFFSYSGGCKTLEFQSHVSQKALKGHVIKSVQVTSDGSCMDECFAETRCASYNLGPFQGDLRICELSDSNDVLHPEDLQQQHGYLFRAVKVKSNKSLRPVEMSLDLYKILVERN